MGTFAFAAATLGFTDGRKKLPGLFRRKVMARGESISCLWVAFKTQKKLTEFLRQISQHVIAHWEEGNLFQFWQLLPSRTPVKPAAFISEVKSNDASGEWKQKALICVAEFTPSVKSAETKNVGLEARISLPNSEWGFKATLQ